MSPQQILDETIVEPPPPFPSIDELIARERRRGRVRRTGAVSAAAAGVFAVVLAITIATGTGGGHGPAPTAGAGPTPLPPDETTEARDARLAALLSQRVAAVFPGGTVAPANPEQPTIFGGASMNIGGYDSAEATVTITTAAGTARLRMMVHRPLAPPQTPPMDSLVVRCRGNVPETSCVERPGPGGSTVFLGERSFEFPGSGSIQSHVDGFFATAVFPDGGVVTAFGAPGTITMTAEDVAAIAADPGYVNAAAPARLPYLPPDPVIGTVYEFDLYSHCGIELASFAGRNWRALEPDDGSLPGAYIAGTMQLLDHVTARFVIDQQQHATDRDVIIFQVTQEAVPVCR